MPTEVQRYFDRYFPPEYFADYFPEVPQAATAADLPPELMYAYRQRSKRERGRSRAAVSDDAEVLSLVFSALDKLAA